MNFKGFLFFGLLFFMCSCNFLRDKKRAEVRRQIVGNWERIVEKDSSTDLIPSLISASKIERMDISTDSIDSYLGFFRQEFDSIRDTSENVFLGNKLAYKILSDSIFIRDPRNGNRQFKWRFVVRSGDTLFLTINEEYVIKYKKQVEQVVNEGIDFDQVIYSRSGCYGNCPIVDISMDNKGTVLFHGEGYVNSLGFYKGKVKYGTKEAVFHKFRQAKPLSLRDNYEALHTDDETYTTTFVKNGKIVKTIQDYGMVAPKEMIWAYSAISNIYTQIPLIKFKNDPLFYPRLQSFVFEKSDFRWVLEKSEGFFLWTELERARKGCYDFKTIYVLSFLPNLGYWGPDPKGKMVDQGQLKLIKTDGRYYRFEFKDGTFSTYDLGYNFVHRNWKEGFELI